MVPPGLPVITTDRTLGAGTASNCPPPLLMVMGFAFTADTVITVCGVSWKSKFTVVPDGTAKVFGVKARFLTVDRKSTRLNSSHRCISYAVFCLKKKKK